MFQLQNVAAGSLSIKPFQYLIFKYAKWLHTSPIHNKQKNWFGMDFSYNFLDIVKEKWSYFSPTSAALLRYLGIRIFKHA